MQIKVMADYDCAPLWWDDDAERMGPIEPETIGLSDRLCADLQSWAAAFDATLVRDDPKLSGFVSEAEERAFYDCGRELAKRVADELGVAHQVRYWHDWVNACVVQPPESVRKIRQ